MNYKECIRPVSLDVESYQSDAINMLRLIRLSEKDIAAGHYKPAEEVFVNIKKKYNICHDFTMEASKI